MNCCQCGCGALVKGTWKRGHIGRTAEGKKKITPWAKENPFVNRIGETKRNNRAAGRYRLLRRDNFKCDICGIQEWNGQKLSLIVDHIDGNRCNDTLENLRLVCPNCESLLPTHAGRNIGRKSDSLRVVDDL